jgi:release factor glutamine methyltransferase
LCLRCYGRPVEGYRPTVDAASEARLRRWHENAYQEVKRAAGGRVTYLGREFDVPADVFPTAPMSQLLGRAVLDEVRETDRVLDMGTGSGVNAILAASRAARVVGVDINPHAVASAAANARRNGVADRTTFLVSDVFDAVDGAFDLIIFDPPFRWFARATCCRPAGPSARRRWASRTAPARRRSTARWPAGRWAA